MSIYRARQHMLSALYAIVRPSVCLSVTWVIIQKRLKLGSWNFHPTVAPSCSFWRGNFYPEILRGSPRAGSSNKGEVGKISHFLALSVNISKTVADIRLKLILITNLKSHVTMMWAFDWHQDRWPWMTLNCCEVKFCRNFAWFRDFGRQQRLNEWR